MVLNERTACPDLDTYAGYGEWKEEFTFWSRATKAEKGRKAAEMMRMLERNAERNPGGLANACRKEMTKTQLLVPEVEVMMRILDEKARDEVEQWGEPGDGRTPSDGRAGCDEDRNIIVEEAPDDEAVRCGEGRKLTGGETPSDEAAGYSGGRQIIIGETPSDEAAERDRGERSSVLEPCTIYRDKTYHDFFLS